MDTIDASYAVNSLVKGYLLYICKTKQGYSIKAVDPKYQASLDNFRKFHTYNQKLYSTYTEIKEDFEKLQRESSNLEEANLEGNWIISETDLMDRLNPDRDLPQVVRDAISKTWNELRKDYELYRETYKQALAASKNETKKLIDKLPSDEDAVVNFKRSFQDVLKYVNDHIDWELPACAQGAYNVWFNGREFMVDVETSDGGVSAIVLENFKRFVEEKGKVSEEDFCECFIK